MNKDLEQYLKTWISEYMCIPQSQISTDSKFTEDLGFDSLDFVELLMVVEEFMGEEIDEYIAEKFETINDVLKYFGE